MAAHPFDLLKINQQVTGAPIMRALRSVGDSGPASLYRGVGAGVSQKVLTRGPMFLASEACTQGVQRWVTANRDVAVFIGSACSGYITGFCAASAEWAKVQRGLSSSGCTSAAPGGGVRDIVRRAVTSHHGVMRLHGAGCRNAVFDSVFFATEHGARNKANAPPALSYACAAALAVTLDFPLDAAVKRSMAVPPSEPLRHPWPLLATLNLLREKRLAIFCGLGAKTVEFAISFAVTGYCSTTVLRWMGMGR